MDAVRYKLPTLVSFKVIRTVPDGVLAENLHPPDEAVYSGVHLRDPSHLIVVYGLADAPGTVRENFPLFGTSPTPGFKVTDGLAAAYALTADEAFRREGL